jgi:hypothetical protein
MRVGYSRSLLAAAALLVATGCSSAAGHSAQSASPAAKPGSTASSAGGPAPASSGSASGSAQSASIHPGHSTPEDAVDGYIKALLAGNQAVACSYVDPSSQSACASAPASSIRATGNVTIGKAAMSGLLAVVPITGRICSPSNGCQSNSNPAEGMPTGSETVSQAVAAAQTGSGFSPVPCIYDGGWYIYVTS